MSLSEIEKKLYQNEKDENLSKYDKIDFDARKIEADPQKTEFVQKNDVWEEKPKDILKEDRNNAVKIAGIAFAILMVIIALGIGFYFFKKISFSDDKVTVSIVGPKEANSGEMLEYRISFNNDNWADINEASLKLSYPENFIPEEMSGFRTEGRLGGVVSLGELKGGKQGVFIFKGRVYSPRGTLAYITADLSYSASGTSGQYVSNNKFGLNVISSPITLNFMAPQNISNGDFVDFLVTYKNEGREGYDNLKVKIDYPQGFTFSKSDPAVSEGENIFYIGHLSAGQEGKIIVSGRLEGNKDEIKVATAYLGNMQDGQFVVQNEEKVQSVISSSPISIFQLVNGMKDLNINAGEDLRFQITYKNEGSIGLRNVIITEKIDSVILDYSTLRLPNGGFFNMADKTITWKASDISQLKLLESGKSGTIEFEVKVKEAIPVSNAQAKNFVVSSIAKIDSPDIPTPVQGNKIISGNRMDMKLNSKVALDVKGFYNDSFISNSGPIPPKVGEETTYTIRWNIINVSNNISSLKVESVLPTGSMMTGKIHPENANLTFNERNNSVVWDIGNVDAGLGILTAPKEVRFQVKIIPSPNQSDTMVGILGPSVISGTDLFTKQQINITEKNKTTYLPEDSKIGDYGYKVIK